MGKLKDILGQAFVIGSEAKYRVKIIEDEQTIETKDWTYIELGMYLIANPKAIDSIDIILI